MAAACGAGASAVWAGRENKALHDASAKAAWPCLVLKTEKFSKM